MQRMRASVVENCHIEVRLDILVDGTSGAPKSCVQFSKDGGATWTGARTSATFTTSPATYLLGNATDTWGHTWTTDELGNLRARINNIASNGSRDFSLEWMSVRITYRPLTIPAATPTLPAGGSFPTTGPLDDFDRPNSGLASNSSLITPLPPTDWM